MPTASNRYVAAQAELPRYCSPPRVQPKAVCMPEKLTFSAPPSKTIEGAKIINSAVSAKSIAKAGRYFAKFSLFITLFSLKFLFNR